MKLWIAVLLSLSGSFAVAELNRHPKMPPATDEFQQAIQRELSFIRLCSYLAITKKGLNLDNSDASLEKARFLIEAEVRNLIHATHLMQRDQPFFKYGNVGTPKMNAAEFKQAWHDYFYTVLNEARHVLEASAGLPVTHELDRFHSSFFILFYQVTAELAKVKVHVTQPWWVRKLRPYPAVSPLFDLYELPNVYSTLDYLQTETTPSLIQTEAVASMNAFLKASDNKGSETFKVQTFEQFYLMREFWQERELPAEEAELLSKVITWEDATAYRAHMGVEGCARMLESLKTEVNPIHPYYRSENTGIYGND